ncbi:MAG: CBS domain-containing protein [Hyphomicrobiales bacterium]|nr:CBS domain-containing protein [Hyphomicrobiales bacterium]
MTVAAILKDKGGDVVTATPDTSLLEIAKILRKHKIGCIVIRADGETIEGIVSERDLVRIIATDGPEALESPVTRCMTKKVVCCQESDTVDHVMAEMTSGRFRHIPVIQNEKLIGLVSIGDVVKQRIADAEMEAAAMRSYIATG